MGFNMHGCDSLGKSGAEESLRACSCGGMGSASLEFCSPPLCPARLSRADPTAGPAVAGPNVSFCEGLTVPYQQVPPRLGFSAPSYRGRPPTLRRWPLHLGHVLATCLG